MERKAEDVLEAFIPTLVIGHELGTPAQVYSTDVAPVLVSDYDMPSGADDGDAVIMHSKLYDLFGLHLKREFMVSSPNSFFIAIKRVTKLTTFR